MAPPAQRCLDRCRRALVATERDTPRWGGVQPSGVRFDQIYGDNSGTGGGQTPFDTDRDGAATQEDEFVSISNDNATPLDISGWQIWSDSTGSGAPDRPVDGLYRTFPPGTVLQPGETLYIVNEITGPAPSWLRKPPKAGSSLVQVVCGPTCSPKEAAAAQARPLHSWIHPAAAISFSTCRPASPMCRMKPDFRAPTTSALRRATRSCPINRRALRTAIVPALAPTERGMLASPVSRRAPGFVPLRVRTRWRICRWAIWF